MISNGKKLNDTYSSNVKVEDIHDDYLNIKIVFEDESIAPITKKFLQLAEPGTGARRPVSVVYKIVEKKGKYKLRFVSRSDKKIQESDVIIINNR